MNSRQATYELSYNLTLYFDFLETFFYNYLYFLCMYVGACVTRCTQEVRGLPAEVVLLFYTMRVVPGDQAVTGLAASPFTC